MSELPDDPNFDTQKLHFVKFNASKTKIIKKNSTFFAVTSLSVIRTQCNIFARSLFFHPCFFPNSAFVHEMSELPDNPNSDAQKKFFAKFSVNCLEHISL